MGAVMRLNLARIHHLFIEHDMGNIHPIYPLVRWWQKTQAGKPGILQKPVGKVQLPGSRHTFQIAEREIPTLDVLPMPSEKGQQLTMSLPDNGRLRIPWVSRIFDEAKGLSETQGAGATWEEALFYGFLVHLDFPDRDGTPRLFEIPVKDLEGWIFPSGKLPNPGITWHKIPTALRRIDSFRIPVKDHRGELVEWRPVAIDGIPTTPEGVVTARLSIPASAQIGAAVNWPLMVNYRPKPMKLYRAYLAACVIQDRIAHSGYPVTRETPQMYQNMLPKLTAADLAKLIAEKDPQRAVKAFKALHSDGVIDLDEVRIGKNHQSIYRIFGYPSKKSRKRRKRATTRMSERHDPHERTPRPA